MPIGQRIPAAQVAVPIADSVIHAASHRHVDDAVWDVVLADAQRKIHVSFAKSFIVLSCLVLSCLVTCIV